MCILKDVAFFRKVGCAQMRLLGLTEKRIYNKNNILLTIPHKYDHCAIIV